MNRYYCDSNSSISSVTERRSDERGIALVMTLLLLSVLTALSLGMAIALSSQTLIGGYYRNFRGSFYAADSGTNIAVQYMANNLVSSVPATFANVASMNTATITSNIDSQLNSNYGSLTTLNSGGAAGSWKESFQIQNPTLTLATNPPQPQVTSSDNTSAGCKLPQPPCPTGYSYTFTYSLTAVGAAQGTEQASIQETGNITLGITGHAATNAVSFAYFGGFVDKYPECLGPLVPGTMTGPMFTNDQWEFMPPMGGWTSPYIFTDPVGQASGHADYWNTSWQCFQSTGTSYGAGQNLVAPTFQQGYQMSQPTVPLPTNSFSQEWAVVDGKGTGEGTSTPALQTTVQDIHGTAYPSSTPSSGVFLANPGTTASACGTKTPPCVQGGGFYVEGNAQILLEPSGTTAQVYQITQGSTVTTITIDPAANSGAGTTVITQGSTTETLNGVPWNNITNQASTMVYVDGSITGMSGPGEGQAAVQDNAMITVTALNDVTITGDVLYKTEPVTYTQNQIIPNSNPACCAGTPMDTLIPGAANMNQVLGIYTANGNFDLKTTQPDQNIQVDGSIATISTQDSANNCSSGEGGFLNTGGHINTFNNVGGQIQSCIYAADINTENIWFDRRFTARGNFAPPWFPATTLQQGGPLPTNTTPQISRVQWLNTTSL